MTETIRFRNPVALAKQGEREAITYRFDWSAWGTPVNTPVFVIELESDGTDMSNTLFTGLPSILGQSALSPVVAGVTKNIKYRLSCKVELSGYPTNNLYEAYAFILGDR